VRHKAEKSALDSKLRSLIIEVTISTTAVANLAVTHTQVGVHDRNALEILCNRSLFSLKIISPNFKIWGIVAYFIASVGHGADPGFLTVSPQVT